MNSHNIWNPSREKDDKQSNTPSQIDKKFQRYLSALQEQYLWLESYLPQPQLDRYLNLIAFSNFTHQHTEMVKKLQLRDLHMILSLWDLELGLKDKEIPREILTQIDSLICDLTEGFCKQGLVTRRDLIIRKREILSGIHGSEKEIFKGCLNNELSPFLKEGVKNLLYMTVVPK